MNRYQLAYYLMVFFTALVLIAVGISVITAGGFGFVSKGVPGALLGIGGVLLGSAIPLFIYGIFIYALRDWKECQLGKQITAARKQQETAASLAMAQQNAYVRY